MATTDEDMKADDANPKTVRPNLSMDEKLRFAAAISGRDPNAPPATFRDRVKRVRRIC